MDGGSGGERNVISFRMDGVGEREMLLGGGERNVISFRIRG